MKNVAIINVSDFSSPGKIATGLHKYLLDQGYKSIMCYAWGQNGNDKDIWKFSSEYQRIIHALMARITGLQGFFSYRSTYKLIKRLRKEGVDTIFGLSMHGYFLNYPLLYNYLSKDHIAFVNVMIDEYPYLGKCCYNNGCLRYQVGCGHCPQIKEFPTSWFFDTSKYIFKKKKDWYDKCPNMVFCGPQVVIDGAKTSPLLKMRKLYTVDEAIDISFYQPCDPKPLRKALGINEEQFVCVCIAPSNNPRKGTKYFEQLARAMKDNPNYKFVHVGYVGNKKESLPSNYIPIGFVDNQETLKEYYSLGDLFVFPSIADSMPNACLEAMACGTPLLLFDVSGMRYMVNDNVGILVQVGDIDAMKEAVLKTPRKDNTIIHNVRNYALSRYDNQAYYSKLVSIAMEL